MLSGVHPDGVAPISKLDNPAGENVTIVAPPDPEFLENRSPIIGGNLVYKKDGTTGKPVIRRVGDTSNDPSGNNLTSYTAANFLQYTTDTNRALMLYWVVNPTDDRMYMGEEMYAAWSSVAAIRPIRDVVDASGNAPTLASEVKEVHKFTMGRALGAETPYSVKTALQNLQDTAGAPRMYLPVSKFIVVHEHPTDDDVHQNGTQQFDVPFAYEVSNSTDFYGEPQKSIMGGRVMQMVSQYLFDNASNKEMDYFPFLLNESKLLTDKIIDALATKIKAHTADSHEARTVVLNQIMVKHGRRYFEEYAVLNELTGEKVGNVWDVLSKLDELFLFFSVTVKTTVSNRTKDDVEVIKMVEVPVVVRVFDNIPL